MTLKDTLTGALRDFIESRPGFDWANYVGAPDAYRADYAKSYRDLRDARELLRAVELSSLPGELLLDALSDARRLTWDGQRLEYTTGQYYPTEYRAAACRALCEALWAHYRDAGNSGEALRRTIRNVLGARLTRRWFA